MLEFICFLDSLQDDVEYELKKPLSSATTLGVGGVADVFILPKNVSALINVLCMARKCDVPCAIIGNGSNLLCSDAGFSGAVICTKKLCRISRKGDRVCALCGAQLTELSRFAADAGLSGFEGLCSIPGTVGGGIPTNAGAFGQSLGDNIYGVTVLTKALLTEYRRVSANELSYRHSDILKQGELLISAYFKLGQKDKAEIYEKMAENKRIRAEKQPFGRSAGSFFKKPDISENSPYFGYSAGRLIDMCGLKGVSVGGAEISGKHGNFIMNSGGATECDIKALAEKVKQGVWRKYGVALEEEVIELKPI